MSKKSKFTGNKSPYNYEKMDSDDEKAYAEELETDDSVLAWTKKHGISIKYRNKKGGISRYFPDFLVRRKNQTHLELIEVKGAHLRYDPNTDLKKKAAENWCKQRGMTYKLHTYSS